jgi:hypothetical protein
MNDDYLWDKSGKPDPDVQQLEEILGTLRYQPRELEIPPHVQVGRKSFIARGLAIAAAVALVMLGLGVWMNLQQEKTTDGKQAAAGPVDEKKLSNLQASVRPTAVPATAVPESAANTSTPRRSLPLAVNRTRPRQPRRPQLSESEVAEARLAKDQLMLALRLASSKLSLAQKKTQGNSVSETHNQHKAG